jgi:hypothetical protein
MSGFVRLADLSGCVWHLLVTSYGRLKAGKREYQVTHVAGSTEGPLFAIKKRERSALFRYRPFRAGESDNCSLTSAEDGRNCDKNQNYDLCTFGRNAEWGRPSANFRAPCPRCPHGAKPILTHYPIRTAKRCLPIAHPHGPVLRDCRPERRRRVANGVSANTAR